MQVNMTKEPSGMSNNLTLGIGAERIAENDRPGGARPFVGEVNHPAIRPDKSHDRSSQRDAKASRRVATHDKWTQKRSISKVVRRDQAINASRI